MTGRVLLVALVLGGTASVAAAAPPQGAPPAPPQAAPSKQAAPQPPRDSCVACHTDMGGDERLEKPVKLFAGDIHRAKGFSCAACHGGDPSEEGIDAMDPNKGFIGKPDHRKTVEVCGRCHSDARFMKQYNPSLRVDQVAEYATSVHGRRLRELNDPKVATCSSCHPAHTIKPKSDPNSSVHPLHVADTCGACHADPKYMPSDRIRTDQLALYKKSIHWKTMSVKGDLAAPTCNSCHGNHGAAPPGVGWVGNVCGQCHTVMGELFAKSVHAKAFAQMGVPGCAACHNNHDIQPASDEMVGLGGKAVCAACHAAGDKGGATAVEIRKALDALSQDQDKARALLERAEHAGMEVSQASFELNGANDALVKARASIHAFNLDAVKKEADPGFAISAKVYARGQRALEELKFRRKGLVVSLVIILVLIAGLVMKIRSLEPRPRTTDAGASAEGER